MVDEILEHKAPELQVKHWIDADGKSLARPIRLSDYNGKFIIIFCFQYWCPGCHTIGIPALQVLIQALAEDKSIVFLAIQTVFEGREANTYDRLFEMQSKYGLKIPFGHDDGDDKTSDISSTMYDYHSGGTPWFILIDENRNVVFNYFHLDVQTTIDQLRKRERKVST